MSDILKKVKLKKYSSRPIPKLKKKLDVVFSKYIRVRDRNICFTCGYKREKGMQCGHFVPRQYNSTRYSELNNHAQCYVCNMLYGGQPDIYALKLEKKYGEGTVKKLNALRRTTKQFTVNELEEMIKVYKLKVAELER